MEIVFYGAGNRGKEAFDRYKDRNDETIVLKGFADSKKTGEYCGYPIIPLSEAAQKEEVHVVITIKQPSITGEVYNQLKKIGIKHIYWFLNRDKTDKNCDFLEAECMDCSSWGECVLPAVEMHIADYCNLNCKGCTHFSPIFEKGVFPDFESRMRDVKMLKEKMPHIMVFSILGGEPFLNPDIERYVAGIREILPDTCIQIVTNGVLIPQLESSVLESIRENRIAVSISEYQPTHRMIDRIEKRLKEFGILYEVRPYEAKKKFVRPLSLKKESRHPHMCISKQCVNLWNGKIARCPTLMYIDRFNEEFHQNLPNAGILQLEDCPSGLELLEILQREVPLCGHCVCFETEWEQCKGAPVLTDFANLD